MKKILFIISLLALLFPICVKAQLEKVIVETYYISDTLDATDTIGGGLEVGSTTYRVYIDLAPGSKLTKIYGDVNHALKINSTQPFFNNKADGQSFAKEFAKNRYVDNTVALDTWLTLGQTTKTGSKTYFGILKANDNDGSFVGGANNDGGSAAVIYGLFNNNNPLAGIALTIADGMDTMTVLPTNWADNGIISSGIDSTIFGSVLEGSQFNSNNVSLQNSGVAGVLPDSNQILIAQLTTKGEISFDLNIEVIDTNGTLIKYVANDSILLAGEILNRYLKYPYEQSCGCPDPLYLEYNATRDCDAQDSCKHLIVFGCMDPLACNYDQAANFNLQELCCYPGYCNDRDISVVCPTLIAGNRELNIYPNPTQHQLTLKISGDEDASAMYVIYNSFGRIVAEKNCSVINGTNLVQVDVTNLETGLYMIQLRTNDSLLSKLFMKN